MEAVERAATERKKLLDILAEFRGNIEALILTVDQFSGWIEENRVTPLVLADMLVQQTLNVPQSLNITRLYTVALDLDDAIKVLPTVEQDDNAVTEEDG